MCVAVLFAAHISEGRIALFFEQPRTLSLPAVGTARFSGTEHLNDRLSQSVDGLLRPLCLAGAGIPALSLSFDQLDDERPPEEILAKVRPLAYDVMLAHIASMSAVHCKRLAELLCETRKIVCLLDLDPVHVAVVWVEGKTSQLIVKGRIEPLAEHEPVVDAYYFGAPPA